MGLVYTENIEASAASVWALISDLDGAADRISAITKVEVVHRPENGSMLGLKWRETRMMMGREATETMVISAIEPGKWFETHAQSCGTNYTSRISVADLGERRAQISFSFDAQPLTWWSSILALILTPLMSLTLKGCIAGDIADIKAAAEN